MDKNKALRRLVGMFPNRWLLLTGVAMTILMSFVTVSFSYLLKVVIDSALASNREIFFSYISILAVLVALNGLFVFIKTRALGGYTERGMAKLREAYGQKSTDIAFKAMQRSHSGDVLSRGTNDMSRVRQFTAMTLPRLIEIPLTAVLALGLLLFLSWRLSLITLVMLPVLIIGSTMLSKPIGAASKRVQTKLGSVNTVVTDFIKGAEVAKAYNLETVLEKKNHDYVEQSIESGTELAKRRAMLEAFSMIISILPYIGTFLIGGYFVIEGHMTIGGLLAFISLLNFLTFPLSQMAIIIGEAKRDMAAADRIFETLDETEERKNGHPFDFENEPFAIRMENLTFAYNGDENNVIRNLDLAIRPGETIAFVGPSGGGKSTLAKLLMGFYDAYEGSITIGGHEVSDWHLSTMRNHMALVSQDTFLFPETIRENIAHGNEQASDEAIEAAAKKANAHAFIMTLSDGYESVLSEHGNSLSGGQRQRLSIARAILKDAPILLLDEATSALDTDSEAIVQAALSEFIKDKTTIIIAHRLSTIKDADRICVVEDGAIRETGTHDTLLTKKGTYAKLYEHQLETAKEAEYEEANL